MIGQQFAKNITAAKFLDSLAERVREAFGFSLWRVESGFSVHAPNFP
jgi:hypothetical protein